MTSENEVKLEVGIESENFIWLLKEIVDESSINIGISLTSGSGIGSVVTKGVSDSSSVFIEKGVSDSVDILESLARSIISDNSIGCGSYLESSSGVNLGKSVVSENAIREPSVIRAPLNADVFQVDKMLIQGEANKSVKVYQEDKEVEA